MSLIRGEKTATFRGNGPTGRSRQVSGKGRANGADSPPGQSRHSAWDCGSPGGSPMCSVQRVWGGDHVCKSSQGVGAGEGAEAGLLGAQGALGGESLVHGVCWSRSRHRSHLRAGRLGKARGLRPESGSKDGSRGPSWTERRGGCGGGLRGLQAREWGLSATGSWMNTCRVDITSHKAWGVRERRPTSPQHRPGTQWG